MLPVCSHSTGLKCPSCAPLMVVAGGGSGFWQDIVVDLAGRIVQGLATGFSSRPPVAHCQAAACPVIQCPAVEVHCTPCEVSLDLKVYVCSGGLALFCLGLIIGLSCRPSARANDLDEDARLQVALARARYGAAGR